MTNVEFVDGVYLILTSRLDCSSNDVVLVQVCWCIDIFLFWVTKLRMLSFGIGVQQCVSFIYMSLTFFMTTLVLPAVCCVGVILVDGIVVLAMFLIDFLLPLSCDISWCMMVCADIWFLLMVA